ncbi:MAG: acylphosphatase, partial [Ghiorsea sp.]|nr:acylphosphatase [Ghiorsea sp.]
MKGIHIRVRGVVQGVGFRPFIVHLAELYQLYGQVWNDAKGVGINAWGDAQSLKQFEQAIARKAPPLAKVQHVLISDLNKPCEVQSFDIIASVDGHTATGVAVDAATCAACLADVQNSNDRHYQY